MSNHYLGNEILSPGWSQTWSMAELLTFRKFARFISVPSSHLGITRSMIHTCLAENTTNLSHRSCQTAIGTLTPGLSQTYSMANLVMCCGIIVKVRASSRASFVCSILYTNAESTSYTTPQTPHAPSKRTSAIICTFFVHILA